MKPRSNSGKSTERNLFELSFDKFRLVVRDRATARLLVGAALVLAAILIRWIALLLV